MPKKVLIFAGPVHPNPPLKGAAVETWMFETAKRLINFEPHIVSIGNPFYAERQYKDNIYFYRINFGKLYKRFFQKMTKLDPLSYPKRILKIINEVKPDIIHVHNTVKWFFPIIKELDTKIKKILHFHNEISISTPLEVDAFIGCSNYIVNIYKNNEKIKAKQFKCIYNGVDSQKFSPYWELAELRKTIRRRFKINENEFVVLFVGRISPEKGVEHFVKVAINLKEFENIKFVVVGEIAKRGDRFDYAKKIFELSRKLNNKITFTDVFPPSKIHQIYLIGDVVLIPSEFNEPFGMVALEAMATGLPVITRARGGLKEYIYHGINGFFLKEDNLLNNGAELVKTLMIDKQLHQKISKEARKTAEKFDWLYISEELEIFYNEILEK
ncbi:glycosyltransferase [Thermodesulfovibrio sp. 3907-1M]|uniref:Glycosyltransferase n=1 Tax=Thermodesulfovibrio autotrophicus TaxID=3118333 RepID=A0AAU8GYC2_9BACT